MACSGHLLCRLKHKNKNDAAARRLLRSAATALLVAPGLASADGFDRGFVETDVLFVQYDLHSLDLHLARIDVLT